MEEIFHEKQEGSLCAQHCLNALLQASYFTAVDLATLAEQMDEEERSRMAEGGVHSADYRTFLQQPSGNVDDSGYFSVQVIASALRVWGLDLVPYNSQDPMARSAQQDPTQHNAYICNYRDHWLTIRKIGYQWFNLNSLLVGPELLSDMYLSLFLAQLQQEGYSIFIVKGNLPECSADKALRARPAVQLEKPRLISEVKAQQQTQFVNEEEDEVLSNTLKLTLENSAQDEEKYLQAALSMSLSEFQQSVSNENANSQPTPNDNQNVSQQAPSPREEMSEEEMLEAAIKMSMET